MCTNLIARERGPESASHTARLARGHCGNAKHQRQRFRLTRLKLGPFRQISYNVWLRSAFVAPRRSLNPT